MKLIKTYDNTVVHDGYYDCCTGNRYTVSQGVRYGMTATALTSTHSWSVVTQDGVRLSPELNTREEAMAELDRIAALIEGEAPAQGWVKGAPPKDGQWYMAIDRDGDPTAVRCDPNTNDIAPWQTATQFRYVNNPAYHLPTPIQPPKES